jgi:protein-tyrosine phosphatase
VPASEDELGPWGRFTEIEPGLWMGACPVDEAPGFADAILDVYARHEYDRGSRPYRAEPLLDWAALPDPELLESLARWVDEQRGAGRTVLIHCEAGHNRSGLLTALYLIRHRGYDPESAIALVQEKRGPNALWNGSFLRYLRES